MAKRAPRSRKSSQETKKKDTKPRHRPKKPPKSQVLPGMSKIRLGRLDNACEAIADYRGRMNAARTKEKAEIQAALQVMIEKKVHTYKHARVALTRSAGADKISVRLLKEDEEGVDMEGGQDNGANEPEAGVDVEGHEGETAED